MLTALSNQKTLPHEIVQSLGENGFALHKILVAMLNEEHQHQGPRKGSGYTQATRFLADIINQPRGLTADKDLQFFSAETQKKLKAIVAYSQSSLGRLPNGFYEIREDLENRSDTLTQKHNFLEKITALEQSLYDVVLEESKIVVNIIASILGVERNDASNVPILPHLDERIAIGTCPEAERYFLEFAGGYVRRQGIVNVIVDEDDQPLLVEKINIGDSHSCLTLREVKLNGILIPPGSLLGTNYASLPIDTHRCAECKGSWMPVSLCRGFRFLRLSTLAISPKNRVRAFGNHLNVQLEGNAFFDPCNTELEEVITAAKNQRPK